MSDQVKRFVVDMKGTGVECVFASDYAALQAECASLKNSLLAITTRHFAEGWKQTSKDSELEQYLSTGIAQLEKERNAALAECERLKEALREIEWSNDSTWQSDRAKEALSAKP